MALTFVKSTGIDTTGNYTVNGMTVTGNVTAANIVTSGIYYPNGTAYTTGGGSGSSTLTGLSDVSISNPVSGEVLKFNGSSWVNDTDSGGGGSSSPGEVTLDVFTANGSQTDFTLSVSPQYKKYTTIHIDGIYQTSNIYSLSGNVLTLVEAPTANSIIEVRTNLPGQVNSVGTLSGLTVAGDILPSANVTYDLGSPTYSFKDLYLSGNTLFFGGASIKTDDITGAVTIIPKATANTPNPTGLVITTEGTLATVNTSNGSASSNAIANAVANASSSGGASVTVANTAPNSNVAGSLWYDNVNTGELYVYDGNAWVSTSIVPMTNAAAPLLSGVNQANEGSNVTITITNYDSQYAYLITVSAGTVTRTNGQIYWVMPTVSANTAHSMTVQSIFNGVSWSITTKNITVLNTSVSDTAIVVSNFGYRDLNTGWI